jgi:hypothetical protein
MEVDPQKSPIPMLFTVSGIVSSLIEESPENA